MSWERACALEDQLSEEVAELLEQAEAADANHEDSQELPEELERRQDRLAGIRRAKAMIEERAAERYETEQAAHKKRWPSDA